jgi:hypothetical protein
VHTYVPCSVTSSHFAPHSCAAVTMSSYGHIASCTLRSCQTEFTFNPGEVLHTPAQSLYHVFNACGGLHVRRESLGAEHRSRAILCRAVPKPSDSQTNESLSGVAQETQGSTCAMARMMVGTVMLLM